MTDEIGSIAGPPSDANHDGTDGFGLGCIDPDPEPGGGGVGCDPGDGIADCGDGTGIDVRDSFSNGFDLTPDELDVFDELRWWCGACTTGAPV